MLTPVDQAGMRLTAHYNRATPAVRDAIDVLWNMPQKAIDEIFPRITDEARKLFHARRSYADALMAWRSEEAKRLNNGVYDFPTYSTLYKSRVGASLYAPGAWA